MGRVAPGGKIALWGDEDRAPVETVDPRPFDHGCSACELGGRFPAGKRCLRPLIRDREGPALLVVSGAPGRYEQEQGVGFLGEIGREVRRRIDAAWPGRVVYDHALKCSPGATKPGPGMFDACRPYLSRAFEFYDYDRVLLLGRGAARGFLGRAVDVESIDVGWAWLRSIEAPAIVVQSPAAVARNRVLLAELYDRIERAVSGPKPRRPALEAVAIRVSKRLVPQVEAWAEGAAELTVDVETAGRVYDPDFRILCLSIAREESDTVWVWDEADLRPGSPTAECLMDVAGVVPMVAHNRNYEVQTLLRAVGLSPPGGFCTLNAFKLYRPFARAALDVLQDLVGAGGSKLKMKKELRVARAAVRNGVVEKARVDGLDKAETSATLKRSPAYKRPDAYAFAHVDHETLLGYNARDTLTTAWVRRWIADNAPPRVEALWRDHVAELADTCTYMERVGLACDRGYARGLQKRLVKTISDYDERLSEELRSRGWSKPVNWESPKQIAEVLFGFLGHEPPWRTEAGAPATDKHALQKLAATEPIAEMLLGRRRSATLAKTYAWGFDRFIQGDGRIHPSLKPYGTETGRLSGADPNPQNLPRGSDPEGKMVKNLIVAPPGRYLAVFDHATLEIRVAAALAQDPVMLELLRSGVDFHLATARIIHAIFGVDPATITKDHWLRSAAKTLYFALLYGKGDATAAEDLDVEIGVAASVRSAILGANVRLAEWIRETENGVRRDGGVWIARPGVAESRWRPLPWVWSANRGEASKALRQSVNSKVQGFGAEINNTGMIHCRRWLEKRGRARHISMPLAVHDSLVFEFDKQALDEVLEVVPRLMTGFDVGAPLVVDAAVGERFGDVERVEL